MIKYGVIGKAAFQQDLYHWSHLYISGRLHKPVAALKENADTEAAQQHNLHSALTTALLLAPKACTLKVSARIVRRDANSNKCFLTRTE